MKGMLRFAQASMPGASTHDLQGESCFNKSMIILQFLNFIVKARACTSERPYDTLGFDFSKETLGLDQTSA